jgi:uncharacterized protein YbjQ (UPF0145 family)
VIFTTTPNIEGHRITQYHGVVNGEAILGANIFKDIMAHGQRQRHGCHDPVTVPARLGVRWLLPL